MMKAPGDTRPTWRNGVLQIHITRACDLACTGCTQGSNLGGKPVIMSLENFEIAVKSVQNYYGVIGIFGGNPTMHPKFTEICRILEKYVPKEQRGLWSNNLNGYGTLCREIFNPAYSNLNVHTVRSAYDEMKRDWPESRPIGLENDSRHAPPFVAMKDVGISREEQTRLIENCDINQLWSAMICEFRGKPRAFFCELAGAQAMLHQNELDYPDTGMIVAPDWWKLPLEYFNHQIEKHCYECGIPLKIKGDLAHTGTKEYVSKTHVNIYNTKKKRELLVLDSLDSTSSVNRATDYIQNGINMNAKVVIGIPTAELARRADFYDNVNMIQAPEGVLIARSMAHGQSPAAGRNAIIKQAIEQDFTHVLFLDDDVIPKPDILVNLLKHDKDMVSGLYLMRSFPHYPITFDIADKDAKCLYRFLQPGDKGLVPILATGLGACLIKIEVFKEMEAPWIRLGELDLENWNDDIGFFRRARKAGFKLFCDLETPLGHMINGSVWPMRTPEGVWGTTYELYGQAVVTFEQKKSYPDELQEQYQKLIAEADLEYALD